MESKLAFTVQCTLYTVQCTLIYFPFYQQFKHYFTDKNTECYATDDQLKAQKINRDGLF